MAAFAINSVRSCLSFSFSLLITLCFPSALANLPHVSSPQCSSFATNFSEHNYTIPILGHPDRSMTLMDQLSFNLYSGSSFASSFTLASTSNSLQEAAPTAPPALAFVLVTSLSSLPELEISGMELSFTCDEENITFSQSHLLPFCKSHPMDALQASCNSSLVSSEEELEQNNSFKDEVRLEYIASSGELHVQASQYQNDEKVTMAFTISNPYGINPLQKNESTTLFVGYVTSSEASNTLLSMDYSDHYNGLNYDLPSTSVHKNHHYNVWIIVVSLLVTALVVGLIVLVLLMRKQHHVRPHRVSATPLARASQRDPEAIGIPMMNRPSLITSPHHDAFQVSGTASWLKQPNPR